VLQAQGTRLIRREDWGPDLDIIRGDGTCTPVIWPGMGAAERTLHLLQLGPGSRTIRLRHPSEAAYYVIEGAAQIEDPDARSSWSLVAGSMFHVEPDTSYTIHADAVGARILGGPCPPDPALYVPGLADAAPQEAVVTGVSIHHRDSPGLLVPFISSDARFVIWLGTGAKTANMNYVVMQPGEANAPHSHESSEDTIFILEGHGTIRDYTAGTRLEFSPGDVIHIDAGIRHAVFADKAEVVVSVGGPCPADLAMLRLLGIDVDAMLSA
jgi:quercetin dioxygenase-like cupin family protein